VNNPGRYDIDVDEGTKPVYISPHRAPAEVELTDGTLSATNSEGFIETMGSQRYRAGQSGDLPQILRARRQRSRVQADYAPYYEVQRELADFYRERNEVMSSIVDDEGYVSEEDLPNIYQPIEEAVEYLLPGVEFEGIKRTEQEYEIQFNNRTGDIVEFDELSSGERDALAIVFSFLSPILSNRIAEAKNEDIDETDIVILFDGPESYMHPQLQLNFLNYLTNYVGEEYDFENKIQVIMVTHSKALIDNIDEDSLFYLLFPDQVEDNQLKISTDIQEELKDVVSEEIGLSALSSGEDLLLVEGPTDREVFSRIDNNLVASVSIIPIGGKDPIVGLDSAFNELVPKLRQSNIELYAIVDRDRDLSLEDNVSENIHALPATMLENLVLEPEPLFSTIENILGEELTETDYESPGDIEELLESIVQDEEFIEWESQTRWNEQFNPLNISYTSYSKSEGFSDIEEFAKNVVENQLNEVDDFKDIRDQVEEYAQNADFDELHGKRILGQVSNEFGIEQDRLLRMTATKVEPDQLPSDTRRFLEDIKDG
jgi:ABC-type thiamine transport system ATPase subunit